MQAHKQLQNQVAHRKPQEEPDSGPEFDPIDVVGRDNLGPQPARLYPDQKQPATRTKA